MNFFYDEARALRKKRRMTSKDVANYIGVCRTTFSRWENGKVVPNELQIRKYAKYLRAKVSDISNLSSEVIAAETDYSKNIKFLADFAYDGNVFWSIDKSKSFVTWASSVSDDISKYKLIVNTLFSALPFIMYIKNSDLKYVYANHCFFHNFSLDSKYPLHDKTDQDIFPRVESKANEEQDLKVILTGEGIFNKIDFIPGSRKKKMCIVFKIPIIDRKGNLEGIMGCFIDLSPYESHLKNIPLSP